MGEAVQANTLPWRRAFSWGRVVVLSLLGLGLLAAVTSDTLHAFLLSLLNTVSEVVAGYPVWGAVLFVVMSAAAAMLAFFSTAVLVPVAVVTWGRPGLSYCCGSAGSWEVCAPTPSRVTLADRSWAP